MQFAAGYDAQRSTRHRLWGSAVRVNGGMLRIQPADTLRCKIYFPVALSENDPMCEGSILDDLSLYFAYLSPRV